jgi:flagellar protein FlaG
MSSNIRSTEMSFFESQKDNFETNKVKADLQKSEESSNNLNKIEVVADKSLVDDANVDNGKNKSEQELSLQESFNKLFGEESTISLLQSRSLEFSVGDYKGNTVVKVIDKESKDVIRQIPSEEFIKMAQRIDYLSDEMQKASGVLLDKQV